MKFVIATNNEKKLRELRAILSRLNLEAVSLREAHIESEPEETGLTFAENALIKARAACAASGLPAIADDSGLEVYALDGQPGVHSARYGGARVKTDGERNALLLENLMQVPEGQRGGRFVCVCACVLPDGRSLLTRGECEGEILLSPTGTGGFGYDPIFYIPEQGATMAELSGETKNSISHRARALSALCGRLPQFLKPEERINMVTSKQRAKLRAMANELETILQIGKGGVTPNIIKQADQALAARELIKGRVLESAGLSAREAAIEIADATKSQPVQVIGTRFVLYRENPEDKKIFLD